MVAPLCHANIMLTFMGLFSTTIAKDSLVAEVWEQVREEGF